MTTKQIETTIDKVLTGLNKAADVITSTMGAEGKNIIIQREGELRFTKDGVSVARSIELPDPIENIGAKMLISAANKTVAEVGDGPQPLWAKVLTPTGFIPLVDIREGDTICGTNKTVQKVVGVYNKGTKEIYNVHFSNGRVVECSIDHLWTVTNNEGVTKTLPLSKLLDMEHYINDKINGKNPKGLYVPNTAVEFKDSDIKIDPYLLGLLVGDGSLSGTGEIELSLGINKEFIIDKIDPKYIKSINFIEEKNYFRIKLQNLKKDLEDLGLYGTTSSTKFIPKNYLYNSTQNRNKLLQGLLDTDGYINKRGRFEYSTVSEQLKNNFIELCLSLGLYITYKLHSRKNDTDSYSNTPIYRITQLSGYKYGNKILKIEPTSVFTEMACIKVTNPDELYVTDNYIVTHNTTFTALMLQTMVNSVIKEIKTKSINDVLNQLEKDIDLVIDQLKEKTHTLTSVDEIEKIATTSSKSKEVGLLFKKLFSETGFDALVNIEKSEYTDHTYFEKFTGIQFDSGFIHPSFMTNKDDESAVYENAYIHISEDPVTVMTEEYKKMLQISYDSNIPLIIIAPRFSDAVFRAFSMNKVNNGAQVCLIKTPGYGYGVKKNIDDIRAFLNEDGSVDRVVIDSYKFILYNDNPPFVEERIAQLKKLRDTAVEWYDEEDYNKRIHKLRGSSAIIYVGGLTPESQSEEYDRIEDALGACKSAILNGYIEGGGKTLLSLQTNNNILAESLKTPCMKILSNANEPVSIIEEIKSKNLGYNVRTKQFENFLESGVIDPAAVVIQGLQNAFTNTKLLINTSFVLNNEN